MRIANVTPLVQVRPATPPPAPNLFVITVHGQRKTPPLPEWRAKTLLQDLGQGRPGWSLERADGGGERRG